MTARWFGFNPPFIGGTQGVLSRQEDLRLIKNDILQLLLTNPGDRVHRPDFGAPIRNAVFEPLTRQFLNNLRSDILDVLEKEEPRVTMLDLILEADSDAATLKITVIGQLTFDPNVKLEVEALIDAPGAAT